MIATRPAGISLMNRSLLSLAGAAALALALAVPVHAQEAEPAAEPAAHEEGAPAHFPIHNPELESWTFAGFFGHFDQAQLQRGFQVYREVCSNCHSMKLVAFRHLGQEGGPHFSEPEVRALAAEYQVTDGPDDAGDMF